jgi:hypothetical protein
VHVLYSKDFQYSLLIKEGSSSSPDHPQTHPLPGIPDHLELRIQSLRRKERVIKGMQIDGQMAGGVYGYVQEYRCCCLLYPKRLNVHQGKKMIKKCFTVQHTKWNKNLFIHLEQKESNNAHCLCGCSWPFPARCTFKKRLVQ